MRSRRWPVIYVRRLTREDPEQPWLDLEPSDTLDHLNANFSGVDIPRSLRLHPEQPGKRHAVLPILEIAMASHPRRGSRPSHRSPSSLVCESSIWTMGVRGRAD
jgi:hypothetical protein